MDLKYCIYQRVCGESHVLAYFTDMMKATLFMEKLENHYDKADLAKEFFLKAWDKSFPEVNPENVWNLRGGVR
jgi:hypothetical protein